MTRCECCGGVLDPNGVDAIEQALRAECERLGIAIYAAGYVPEAAAARLLGWAESTLRGHRATSRPIPFVRVGRQPRYSLRALAEFLAAAEVMESDW